MLSAVIGYPVLRVVFLTRGREEAGELPGLPATREQQLALWGLVDRIAERADAADTAPLRALLGEAAAAAGAA